MDTSPPKKKAKLEDESVTTGLNAKNSPIHIDPNGNLKLIVGPAAVQMHVDANALRRSSKVFDRMLFGGFRESHKTDDWTVKLPEDDPEALRVIFHIAHASFKDLPQALSLSQLYNITMMADKYDMIAILQPWMGAWTSVEEHPELWTSEDENETSREDLERLCVLYHQGLSQKFNEIFLRVVIKTEANSKGKMLYRIAGSGDEECSKSDPCELVELALLPQGLPEFAELIRRKAISALLGGLNIAFESYTSSNNNPKLSRRCRSMALGLMIQHLVQRSLWPIPRVDDAYLSINQLSRIIGEIQGQAIQKAMENCRCQPGGSILNPCGLYLPETFRGMEKLAMQRRISVEFEKHFAKFT